MNTTLDTHFYASHRARETGRMVTVAHGTDLAIELNGDADWWTVCEDHGWLVQHSTLRLARTHAANPLGWCEVCAGTEVPA